MFSVCCPPRSAFLWGEKYIFFLQSTVALCGSQAIFIHNLWPLAGDWEEKILLPGWIIDWGCCGRDSSWQHLLSSSHDKLAQVYLYGVSLALGFSNLDQHRVLKQLQQQLHKVPVDIKISLFLNNNWKLTTRLDVIFLMNKLCKCLA